MKETIELDILAIVIASILGIVLHALHILPEAYVTSLILLLLALHAIHGATQASKDSEVHKRLLDAAERIEEPDVRLLNTEEVFERGRDLALNNKGEMWWFNTPLGIRNDAVFERILKPAIENPNTSKIVFILDKKFKTIWEEEVEPKIDKCKSKEKVETPRFRSIDEKTAFRMIDTDPGRGLKEAHVTFLEKPFTYKAEREEPAIFYPRYALQVKSHSKLIQDLKDMFLGYTL